MRGTSAKSRDEVLDAVDAAQGDVAELGTQLLAAVDVLDANPALRRVLTDPSTDTDAKQDLAASVFGGTFSADTVAVLRTAVGGRWAAGRDLADGLEQAGIAAYVRSAQDAGEGQRFETDLFEAGQVVLGDVELRRAVSDKSAPVAARKQLLADVLGGKVVPTALAVLQQATVARTGSFEKVLEGFNVLVAQRRGRLAATVRVAYDLEDAERERLASVLERKYGTAVQLNVIVDPAVVGGIAVTVGDEVVDATMSTRLESARRALAG
ncbi:F0F1 ATP synthase subunit delta [Aeromicrobium sp. PE09-221]|uniref:F0F1 ATP synthase subunit delta n=1 Tax=Aeromicrobium sp. PE09-221 TaxID=1898043 RepID=UPI000B3E8E93|nr:F0F1 ATP synthase subunit delta [Aeromicrobium sp. PE09-221]OUZ11260.1 F0F1 ATP synthase subunit delta [Aeromicrobium sp. PE09-221]